MTTRTRRSSRSSLRFPELLLLAMAASAPAVGAAEGWLPQGVSSEASEATAADGGGAHYTLYLDVVLNQVPTGQLIAIEVRAGRPHATASALRGIGLQLPADFPVGSDGQVALDDIPGVTARYAPALQRLHLDAPPALLARQSGHLGYVAPSAPRIDPSTDLTGLALNYDVFAQHDRNSRSVGNWLELRAFGLAGGVLSTGFNHRISDSDAGRSHDSVRLDTRWQLDFPDRMVSLTVGDSISGAVGWSRPTRYGGVRLARDFSLQPYRVTTPLASFAGEAALPSTVDLYINGLRQSSQQVLPGQFAIDSVPTLSGAGQAQMVITDINGQQRLVEFSLYGAPQLLQAGLSDWSLDLGFVRRDYGLTSFSYASDPSVSAVYRFGLDAQTTLESHAQGTTDLQLAGVGVHRLLGERGGVLSLAAAASHSDEAGNGRLHQAGYQWSSTRFNLGANSLYRSTGYRDLASLEFGSLPRRSDSLFAGVSLPLGHVGANLLRQVDVDGEESRYAGVSWSRNLPRSGLISVSINRDLDNDRGDSAYVYFSLPLDRLTSLSATARRGGGSDDLSIGVQRSTPGDAGGWGWRAQTTVGDNRGAQAQVTRIGQHGQWSAGIDHRRGRGDAPDWTTSYLSATGGLVLARGQVHAMRRVDDAFAIVDTGGVGGVPVRLENRLVGSTDADGLLLVPRLNAWQRNQLSIDPLGLPANTRVETTALDATPRRNSGMLAQFPIRSIQPRLLQLRSADGQWLPAGSPVWLDRADALSGATADTVVAHDGMVYLESPAADARLHIRVGDTLCELPVPAGNAAPVTLDCP